MLGIRFNECFFLSIVRVIIRINCLSKNIRIHEINLLLTLHSNFILKEKNTYLIYLSHDLSMQVHHSNWICRSLFDFIRRRDAREQKLDRGERVNAA